MDKEKQIEEMAKDIVHQKMFGKCIFENCPFEKDDEILCNNCKVAQYLYNKHYRKITKNEVVFTKEEYKKIEREKKRLEEFAEKLKNYCAYSFIFGQKFTTEKRIDELLKEYEK